MDDIKKKTRYSWRLLNDILKESDGSVYVFNRTQFITNVENFRSAFKEKYTAFDLGYSYKTNYLPALCYEADRLGLYAEVVSGMEYELARQLGIEGEKIIFNGPSKTPLELLRAFNEGALVNVDSLSEVELVSKLAKEVTDKVRIGLRCNLDLKWNGRESRFGLSEPSGELDSACRILRSCPNITIEGLHCHTSFNRSAQSYGLRIKRLIALADKIFNSTVPRFLDVGGGLCGPMPPSLAAQFKVPPSSYNDYAEAICNPLLDRYGDDGPTLIVEPGVALIGNVFDYVYRVEHVKQVGDRMFAMTNGAAHQIKIVPNEVNLPTYVYSTPEQKSRLAINLPIDVVGFTCLEHDVIYRGFNEPLARGDILVTSNVGAYSMVTSPEFIRTTPAVVELENNNAWKVLKSKRTTSELLSLFSI